MKLKLVTPCSHRRGNKCSSFCRSPSCIPEHQTSCFKAPSQLLERQSKMRRCKATRWTYRDGAKYLYTEAHSRCAVWTHWSKPKAMQCRKGTAPGRVPQGVSLRAVNAAQRRARGSRTCCRRHWGHYEWLGWKGLDPFLSCMPKSPSKAHGLQRSQGAVLRCRGRDQTTDNSHF